jgi:aryl-alcohol dehydrogenase-like predicted oxidoreductase
VYSAGESEEIVGKGIVGRRDELVVATKFHAPMGPDPNLSGNSRRWIMREVEASLRRLGTDWIDLYQVHRPDETTDIDDTLGALSDLVHAGKVRYAGCSTFPAEYIVESQWVSERRGRERFVCEQPPYSILVRGIEADVLPTCHRFGMGVIPWSPLAGGYLAGRYRRGREIPEDSRYGRRFGRLGNDQERAVHEQRLDAVEQLVALAEEAGLPLSHVAMAFVLEHPAVTAAIIGPRTMEQLDDLLAGADVRLDPQVLDRIDEIVPPWAPTPGARPASRGRPAAVRASDGAARRRRASIRHRSASARGGDSSPVPIRAAPLDRRS